MEIAWNDWQERRLKQAVDFAASNTTQKIAENKADEKLAAECLKKTQQYKASKAKVIADRTKIIYATGNNQ